LRGPSRRANAALTETERQLIDALASAKACRVRLGGLCSKGEEYRREAIEDAEGPRGDIIKSGRWAFSVGSMLQRQCELVHTSLAQLRVTLMVGNELNSTGNEM